MIEFYADRDGIEYGGCFISGNLAIYADSEEEAKTLKRCFDAGDTFADMADWGIHHLTPEQMQTTKEVYKLHDLHTAS